MFLVPPQPSLLPVPSNLVPLSCLERDKMRQATMKLDRRVKRLMLRDRKYGEALEVGRQWVAITRRLDVLQVPYYT
jgi:hypothetical protein